MARPQMRGPGGRRGMMGGKHSKIRKKTLGRLMKYIQKGYGVQFVVVLICILLSAVANVAGSMFLKSLIDDYISPAAGISGVYRSAACADGMAVIYLIGIATTFIYNWLMVGISQGVLKRCVTRYSRTCRSFADSLLRYAYPRRSDEPFHQRYRYAAADAPASPLPQMFSSAMTIISVFIGMLVTNVWLTLFVLLGVSSCSRW